MPSSWGSEVRRTITYPAAASAPSNGTGMETVSWSKVPLPISWAFAPSGESAM